MMRWKMEVSNIKIRLLNRGESKLKAVASLVIDDCIAVHDIKIIENERGRIIAMPAKKMDNGSYKDLVHPINTETRNLLTESILKEYEKTIEV